jgi:predicted ribosome quality control (RQC) complex YloA/Tae2 family protein
MSLDGIFLKSITDELQDKLINARVDKIYQPDKNEIVLLMRSGGENCKLLMTSISSSPRIHLTDSARKNPEQPPMFCMLLRKHLTGAHVKKIEQMDFDRIVEITFECKDELETSIDKSLIIEIMGKHSNIIFINKNTGTIIDSIRRVAESMSSVRQVMPGLKYEFPPSDKINPLKVTREKFLDVMNKENEGTIIFNFIYKTFTGMSPFISSEICFLAGVYEGSYMGELDADRKDKVWKAFESVIEKVRNKNYKFQIYLSQDENTEFYCLDLENMKNFEKKQYGSAGELLDTYYLEQDNKNKINQRISSLVKSLTTKLERDKKKVEKQRGELLSAEDREKYKIYGELIIANLNKKPENSKLIVTNYYDPEQKEIAIPLDPKLNLAQNSQKFFKRYSKLKIAVEELRNLIASSSDELKYLRTFCFQLRNAARPTTWKT